jgi:hypothetical protein
MNENRTHQEWRKLSEELGIPIMEIVDAFGLTTETETEEYGKVLEQLETSATQEQRWELYDNTRLRKAKEPILKALLDNAKTKEELWEIYFYGYWYGFGEMILHIILEKSDTKEEIERVYRKSSEGSTIKRSTVRALCLRH